MSVFDALPVEHLDARKTLIYGWEKKKSPRYVWGMVAHLLNGGELPPVAVEWPHKNGSYYLDYLWGRPENDSVPDGGHNRVLAHILADVPLPVCITGREGVNAYLPWQQIPIVNIELGLMWGYLVPPDVSRIARIIHRLGSSYDPEYMRQTLGSVRGGFMTEGLIPAA
jgi:hypothetical protein